MGTSAHRRRVSRKARLAGAGAAAAIATVAAFTLTGTAQATAVGAAFSTTGSWSGGYTGQYVLANGTGKELTGWKLTFDLPEGTKITSLWNGKHTISGRSVTVEPESWNKTIAPGASVTVGFVAAGTAPAGAGPDNCRINGAKCSAGKDPGPRPSASAPSPSRPPTPG
ncbi:cellulose binding domain-containing protein, partial [Streptomyces sp. URMC 127]|uniref:cellulose binding domain-containing protein n=1 Tax=Streptomyces sp. URMC 127 TaxID=3423402 RepID=UPI003F1A4306